MLKKLSLVIFFLITTLVVFFSLLQNSSTQPAVLGSRKNSQIIQWKMANTWSRGTPVFEKAAQRFATLVEKMSDGRMRIQIDPANIHKDPFGVFDLVRSGQYEMGHSASYYWKGKDPATPFFTTTPFGMNALEQYAWFYYGGGQKLQQKVYAKHGLLAFPGGNTGVQMGGWFQKEIKSLNDIKGLKLRIAGLAGDIWARLGAIPENIPVGELYTSMQMGRIDALEWVSPYIDIKMGFPQIARYYYQGWQEPAAELQFLINREKFASLPPDLQNILISAMKDSAFDMLIFMMHANAKSWSDMQKKYPHVQVQNFPDDVLAALKQQTQIVLKELSESSPEAKEVIESQQKFLNQMKHWTEISEQNYLKIR